MTGATVVPLHYGFRGEPWPAGDYWLVELHRPAGYALFWCDAYNAQGATGWTHVAQHAAGFGSEEDARAAFASRGGTPFSGEVVYVQHQWAS